MYSADVELMLFRGALAQGLEGQRLLEERASLAALFTSGVQAMRGAVRDPRAGVPNLMHFSRASRRAAWALGELQHFDEARALLKETIIAQRRLLGDGHDDVTATIQELRDLQASQRQVVGGRGGAQSVRGTPAPGQK